MMATSCTLGLMCNKEAIISHSAFSANTCEVPDAPVAIVESEKTAVIAQAKLPDYIWLATGSLTEFKPSKLNVLRNRIVVAFPDLGGWEKWKKTAASLDFPIIVSDYLKKHAMEDQRKQGLDIADFL